MGLVDKFKKILFDDADDMDTQEPLPERTPKNRKIESKKESTGFIEYHHEEEEENPITELKIPTEEPVEEKTEVSFSRDYDVYDEEPVAPQHHGFDDFDNFDMNFLNEDPDEIKLVKNVNSYNVNQDQRKETREIKDYRKMLSNDSEEVHEKKPFTNTPVISPVWGILDKNYKPEEIVDRTEALTKVNTGAVPRSYGPVSYNDQPLIPRKKKEVKKEEVKEEKEEESTPSLKEELVELNTTITELMHDDEPEPVDESPSYEEIDDIDEELEPTHSLDDVVIKTENYDDYEDMSESSIENEKTVNNNIEDAFESTSEFDSIKENDEQITEETEEIEEDEEDEDEELVDLESIVNKEPDDEDDSGLDNTIETDLFNLIDSMYKDNEEE